MQNVKVSVFVPDLKGQITGPAPLIKIVQYVDLTLTEAESSGHFDTIVITAGLYPNLHVGAHPSYWYLARVHPPIPW